VVLAHLYEKRERMSHEKQIIYMYNLTWRTSQEGLHESMHYYMNCYTWATN
jgi:hypothetical protein